MNISKNINSDFKLSLLCYSITMTPGTIVVFSSNKRLLIHSVLVSSDDQIVLSIKNSFEKIISKL